MMPEEVALVTEDRWMREPGGELDPTDREILKEVSHNGRVHVRVLNLQQAFETIKSTEPGKFQRYQESMEKQASKRLTFDELVKFSQKANERMQEFTGVAKGMTLAQAAQVRLWRVDNHMTWRSVARAAYMERWFHVWEPPSNQILGMALAERAAQFFKEDFREPPWN